MIAATTGLPSRSIDVKSVCPRRAISLAESGVFSFNSLMSAPAMKNFSPVPVTIAPRIAASFWTAAKAASSSPSVARLSALPTFGRLTVIVATAPLVSNKRFS